MIKKISFILLVLSFLSISCNAQNLYEKTIIRSDNKVWLVENGRKSVVDEKIVIVKPKTKEIMSSLSFVETKELGFGIFEIAVPENVKVENFVSELKKTRIFEFVDYNICGDYVLSVNDSHASNQWYLGTINAYAAWNITTGSPQVKVAILDSGIDASHYDLGYGNDSYTHININDGYNYPHNTTYSLPVYEHGTMVAGILGAKTNNAIGICGVSGGNNSAGVTILPYCVGDSVPYVNYVISAINYAVEKGASIINMSLGFDNNNFGLQNAINSAYNNSVTIVCATGNENVSQLPYPACYTNTIAVGASNLSNGRWQVSNVKGSNYGDGLDLVAPGESIWSTSLNNGYSIKSGTTLAAPQVSGVVALMLSVNPSLTPSQIKNKLRSTCTKLTGYSYTNGWNSEVGYGLLNAYAAVCAAMNLKIDGPELVYTYGQYKIENLPSDVTVSWSLSNSNYNNYSHLISNFPALGWCLIFRDDNYDMKNDTLKAEIKYNNVTVQTLKKIVNAYDDFWGQYTSGNLSGEINYSHYFAIKTNTVTTVTSPNLYGATVTYDSSGATPTSWTFYPTSGTLYFTAPAGYIPVIINVHDGCGNDYVLYAYPAAFLYNINISYGDNGFTVTLEGSDPERESNEDQPWTVEVRSATTGQLMTVQSSTSRSESISTAGWPKGIYIVKVTIGKEVLTEKVVVK